MSFKPYPHQLEKSEIAIQILRTYGLVYFAMEERTGKTFTAILTADNVLRGPEKKRVLILTKKNALKGPEDRYAKKAKGGWFGALNIYCESDGGEGNAAMRTYEKDNISWTVTNYQQVSKIDWKPDLVILDEAHSNLSMFPDRGMIWNQVYDVIYGAGIIFSSATPHAQGHYQLFNQLALSSYFPWSRYQDGYHWFGNYGLPYKKKIFVKGKELDVPQYDRVKTDRIIAETDHLFVRATRKELGFEHEPEDKVHWIELDQSTRDAYNWLLNQKFMMIGQYPVSLETKMKERTVLHQLEGGALKYVEPTPVDAKGNPIEGFKPKVEYLGLQNFEKINFILENFGDNEHVCIMYNYQAEKRKLEAAFKKAKILQGTSNAEGVDLSDIEHLIVYSQDFSVARHSQRRARQANMKRKTPIIVHHLLVKGGISEQVYKSVSVKKVNFVDSVYKRTSI